LREENAVLERLATIGELAGPLAHEFTDFLNLLLLHVAVLEQRLPETLRGDLCEIRRQGNRAAELVAHFHQYRRGLPVSPLQVDLNGVVAEVADDFSKDSPGPLGIEVLHASANGTKGDSKVVRLQITPATAPALVNGPSTNVKRLVRFLLSNAVRAAAQGGKHVLVATESEDGNVRLHVEDAGPTPAPEELRRLFQPGHPPREGVDALELSASRSLARRLGGGILAETPPAGGLRLTVEFEQNSRR
jgi:signal transduction histidine kinase